MKEKQSVKTQDLGSGSIPKLFLQLVIPAIVAQIVNLLYNLVDVFPSNTFRKSVPLHLPVSDYLPQS